MNTRAMHRLYGAVLLALPTLAFASGDMSGAYFAFFLMPGTALWGFSVMAALVRGGILMKIGFGLLMGLISAATYVVVDLGFRHGFIHDYPARAVWPNILGAIGAGALPFIAARFMNRIVRP